MINDVEALMMRNDIDNVTVIMVTNLGDALKVELIDEHGKNISADYFEFDREDLELMLDMLD